VQCKRGFGDMNCFLIVALLTIVPCEIRADAAQPSLSAAIQWDSAAFPVRANLADPNRWQPLS
jgi:hypothetical protein